ncbi:hypothetical protein ABZY57_04385 [Streptomyces sp. NPDC006450]|uniref:hypothetical protein n=1 Tax=Streptomyces sp. NPDC006450 TaxID=3155458 RepID=UPI0033BA94CC
MRDLLVEYIRRRSANLDYSTLRGLTNLLVRTFWKQIEKINPGQKDLHQTPLPRHIQVTARFSAQGAPG